MIRRRDLGHHGIVSLSDSGVAGVEQEVQDAQDADHAEWFHQQQPV